MTVVLSLKLNEGIVLASDSASTFIVGNPNSGEFIPGNIYYNANKVFNLHKKLPIGAITWGAGSIGNSSVATLMKDFRQRLTSGDEIDESNYTIEGVLLSYARSYTTSTTFPDLQDGTTRISLR